MLQYEQDAKGLWELAVATAEPCTDVGLLIEASNLIQNPSMALAQQCTANGALPAGDSSQHLKVSIKPRIAGCQFSDASVHIALTGQAATIIFAASQLIALLPCRLPLLPMGCRRVPHSARPLLQARLSPACSPLLPRGLQPKRWA